MLFSLSPFARNAKQSFSVIKLWFRGFDFLTIAFLRLFLEHFLQQLLVTKLSSNWQRKQMVTEVSIKRV